MSVSSVVLPAPFAPSSPVIPCPIVNVADVSACVDPHRFATLSATTTGPATAGDAKQSPGWIPGAEFKRHARGARSGATRPPLSSRFGLGVA